MRAKLYEVWFSTGSGTHIGPRFRLLEDAIRFVKAHTGEASYAIRSPGGEWGVIERRRALDSFDGAQARTGPRLARGTGSPSSR